jgi:hypothetical protein
MADFDKKKVGKKMPKSKKAQDSLTRTAERIYVEIDDEVTTVYDRIKRIRADEIELLIPRKALLLQSVVNLKILKKKLDEKDKTLRIVTNDATGKRLAKQIGVAVDESIPSIKQSNKDDDVPRLKLTTSRPERRLSEKLSIAEILRRTGTVSDPLMKKVSDWFRKRKKKKKYKTELVIVTPNKTALITLVSIVAFLLAGIAYIALPGATIYITPTSTRIEQPVNVTLADFEKNKNFLESRPNQTIASFQIVPEAIERTITMPATGKEFRGENARGKIKIVNESPYNWPLVATTRFQTEDGLVFRIQQDVVVPPKKGLEAGTLLAEVVADPFDNFNQIVGERGNISATNLFLPGLKLESSRKDLYGVSEEPFSGGKTEFIRIINQDDIEGGKERAKKEVISIARDELRNYLAAENTRRGTNLQLLEDERLIELSEPHVEIIGDPIGQQLETFNIKASVTIAGHAFNYPELVNLIKTEMNIRKSPGKNIIAIVDDSLTYKIFEIDKSGGITRITATIRGIEQYDINPESENGERLVKKVTDHLLGKEINEATFFLQNLPEIDRVTIKSWPFWAPTLPTVPDNIEFIMQDEESATEGIEADA